MVDGVVKNVVEGLLNGVVKDVVRYAVKGVVNAVVKGGVSDTAQSIVKGVIRGVFYCTHPHGTDMSTFATHFPGIKTYLTTFSFVLAFNCQLAAVRTTAV